MLILLSKLKKEYKLENQDFIQRIGNVINDVSNEKRIKLIDQLPEWVKYKEPILKSFHFLLPEDQIKLVWSFIAVIYLNQTEGQIQILVCMERVYLLNVHKIGKTGLY